MSLYINQDKEVFMGFIVQQGGPLALVNVILAFVVILLVLRSALELFIRKRKEQFPRLRNGIDAILFWSGLMVVLGFLQSFWGFFSGIDSLIASGTGDPKVIMGLIADDMIIIIFSLSFFTVSSIVWFAFRTRYQRLLANCVVGTD